MDTVEYKNKNEKELRALLQEQRAELHRERAKILAQTSKEVHKIDQFKKTIARIVTILRSKKNNI
jgi:ribosomal protein L29